MEKFSESVPLDRPGPSPLRKAAGGAIVFLLVLINCLWWASRLEFNRGADEFKHDNLRRFIHAHGRLPRLGEWRFVAHLLDNTTNEPLYPTIDPDTGKMLFPAGTVLYKNHQYEVRRPYLVTPQLAHLLGGHFSRLFGPYSVMKARVFNAVCIAAAAWLIFLTGLLLWPGREGLAWIAGLSLGLWPQVSFVGSYINDDAFAVFAVALLLFGCVSVESKGFSIKRTLLLGAGMASVFQCKYYVLPIIPLLGIWMLVRLKSSGRVALPHLAVSLVLAVLAGSWWYVHNHILYDGDILGRRTVSREVDAFAKALPPELAERSRILITKSMHKTGQPLWNPKWLGKWFKISLASYFGMLGWMDRVFHPAMYIAALMGVLTPLALLFFCAIKQKIPLANLLRAPVLFSLPYLAGLLALSLLNSYFVDVQPQGRYLLSSIPALVLLLFQGAHRLPQRAGSALAVALLVFFVCENLLANLFFQS